jgi:hypothetical protein
MPRYNYRCSLCEDNIIIFHGINEIYENCESCDEEKTMVKVFSSPIHIKKKPHSIDKKVGDLTKEYIEANRQLLKDEKDKLKKETYEST